MTRRAHRFSGPNRSPPGRTRRQLAEVLKRDLQLIADPDEIITSHIRNAGFSVEACRWECYAHHEGASPNAKRYYQSFSTMTECVKHGVVLIGDDQIEANC